MKDDGTFTAVDVQVENESQMVKITWGDGHESNLPMVRLRGYCPCADCQGHGGAIKWIDNSASGIFGAELVGRYAINFQFSDGHKTGIYRWEQLRKLDPAESERWGAPEMALLN
jgi:DUF971 family protein